MAKFIDIKCDNYTIEMISNGVSNPKAIILFMHGFNGDRWGDGYDRLKHTFEDVFYQLLKNGKYNLNRLNS